MKNSLSKAVIPLAAVLLVSTLGCSSSRQATFATPDSAADALVVAARADSKPELKHIFGDGADSLIGSGDAVADRNAATKFVELYDQKHQIVPSDGTPDSMTLVVGNEDWPFPVPIVKETDGKWRFDTDSGLQEILNRRIGRNELDTVQVCLAIVDAQREYAFLDPDGDGVPEYATKFRSDPGKKNGLYWKTEPGQPPSPLGLLAAEAQAEGYSAAGMREGERRPYHGYFYKILESQGPHARDGAYDYMVNGKMIGGFAVVAWPADYGNSGIMTFTVNQAGVVYQKDLGEETEKLASSMKSFDPDSTWAPVK